MRFEEKGKKVFDDLRRGLEHIMSKANLSKNEVVEEMEKLIRELRKGSETVDKGFERFREDNRESFEKIEDGLKQAAGEVKHLFREAFGKMKR